MNSAPSILARAIGSALVLIAASFPCNAQEISGPVALNAAAITVLVGETDQSSGSKIVIPPEVSWTARIASNTNPEHKTVTSASLPTWIEKASAMNGLNSPEVSPWHTVIEWDQFDEDGDNTHSGVFEEYWVSPTRYQRIYKGDSLNQTDYATSAGLFRSGDQRWPNRAELQVRSEVLDPVAFARTLQNVEPFEQVRTFGTHSLACVSFKNGPPGGFSAPAQYCFEPNSSVLRYVRGFGWFQTTYNDIETFGGHNFARTVHVTDGGKLFLKLRVKLIEAFPNKDEAFPQPPPDAVNLSGKRVTGVAVQTIKQTFPNWPANLRQQHFKVLVQIVIGKDGHVLSANAVDGPQNARITAEETVQSWTFRPYLVLGQPVEVESKIILQCN